MHDFAANAGAQRLRLRSQRCRTTQTEKTN
jgi:hypothetical protein